MIRFVLKFTPPNNKISALNDKAAGFNLFFNTALLILNILVHVCIQNIKRATTLKSSAAKENNGMDKRTKFVIGQMFS